MAHSLPDLGYAYDALEPHIDAQTMEIHHSKHHQAYVNKLNDAISGNAGLEDKSICDLIGDLASVPEDIRTAPLVIRMAARALYVADFRRTAVEPGA